MIAMVTALITLAVLGFSNKDVNIGFGAPLLVDLVAWYIVGAYVGVLPSIA